MKLFDGPAEFVNFLKSDSELREMIAWSDDFISMHENVHKGCKCKERVRMQHRDAAYRDLVANVIGASRPLQSFLLDYLEEDEVKFKLNTQILLEIT